MPTMKRALAIVLGIASCMLCAGCNEKESEVIEVDVRQDRMAEIVFIYTSAYSQVEEDDYEYKEYLIDAEGNIYYADKHNGSIKDNIIQCKTDRLQEKMTLIGTIDEGVVHENYNRIQDTIHMEGYELTSEFWAVNMVCPRERWGVVYYDENGEVCIEDFYKKDNVQYYPYNDTVVEIVEWMNRLFSIKFEWGVF